MSNLEPGCMAIITGGRSRSNIGKIVKCIKFVGNMGHSTVNGLLFGDKDLWEIDTEIVFLSSDGIAMPSYHKLCSAKTLQRIDNDTENVGNNSEITVTV